RVPGLAGREHSQGGIRVGEIDDLAPGRDYLRAPALPGEERRGEHGLLVAAGLHVAAREEVRELRRDRDRSAEPGAVEPSPSPGVDVLAERLLELIERGLEGGSEALVASLQSLGAEPLGGCVREQPREDLR